MMRDIKFRAWDKTRECFIDVPAMKDLLFGYGNNYDYTNGDDVELMQYTGLKDKNGKEIYEGDIVKAASQGHVANCLVKWGQGRVGFFLHRESPSICWSLSGGGDKYDQEIVEVIGNIYQNPELLEAGK